MNHSSLAVHDIDRHYNSMAEMEMKRKQMNDPNVFFFEGTSL